MSGKHVVIVGGGFGGLHAARGLASPEIRVTLVDRRNHHLFQPLLYQVATAALSPGSIATPIRRIFRDQRNVRVLLGEVTAVDAARRTLLLADGELEYDELILATGATHSYFGKDRWAAFAPGLKSIEDALEIRRRIFLAYEAAERELDPERRRAWMTFVVIGAGPTGVEMAGAMAEIARQTLENDFRAIDPADARIVLLEGAPRVLPPMAEELSASARRQLERIGVEVRTAALVTDLDGYGVTIGAGRIAARTIVWAAGVAASPVARTLGVPLDRAGRVIVGRDLSIPGHPEVQVIGDLASFTQDGKPLPGVAPVAMQMGDHAARNVLRALHGRPREAFRYFDKGSMATIGRKAAVADIRGWHLTGMLAWLAWLFVHILFLIGFRNRLVVLFDWAWNYVLFERGARLITGPIEPIVQKDEGPRQQVPRAP